MKTPTRLLVLLAALAAFPAGAPAAAPAAAPGFVDSGRLIVLDRGTPVGYEDFEYERRGDSLLVSGVHTRTVRRPDGHTEKWVKKFGLVVDARDYGLRGYTSNLDFEGRVVVKGIIPGDTAMTVYSEVDGSGDAIRLDQPPGRMFVMDPMMFTLFDVVCRNLGAQALPKRPVEMVTLGDPPKAVRATATAAGPDSIRWGGRRMVSKRWILADGTSTFLLWLSPEGRMLRLVHEGGTLEVLREEPQAAPKPKAKPASR